MNDKSLQTVEQVGGFLEGSEAVEFRGLTAKEKYCWIEEVLTRFGYHRLRRSEKGVIRRYIGKVTGYSRSQVSRLIREYQQTGRLKKRQFKESSIQKTPLSHQVYPIRSDPSLVKDWPGQMNCTGG